MKKILLIEDELEIVKLIKMRLEANHYKVITALDGEDGFAQFLKEEPDLIILDLMLPKISGNEVCRRIRREEEDHTRILMLTSKNQDTDRIIGRVQGADTYMTKPFEGQELLKEVELLLNK